MHRVYAMCLDAAIAALPLIPLYLYLNRHYFHDRKRMLGYLLFAIYLSGVFAVVGLPDIRYIRFAPRYNFRPFAYMFSDWKSTVLNVVLFLPMGFCLPLFWQRFRGFPHATLFGFFSSLFIESAQIFTLRATDVNDLMTNTFGTFLGWCLARLLLWRCPKLSPGHRTKEVYVVCGSAVAVMFFFQPYLAAALWPLFFR